MLSPLPTPAPTPPGLRAAETTSFDAAAHGHAVDWTPRCLLVDGRPRALVSAEFHYFRVPDRARWRPLLAALKGAGFNAVRLYFHWGYHSPREGVLDFDGNRDVRFLLDVCTDLELFVIPAPGPYICAEVQGGGYPLWLIAKRDLRIRHLLHPPLGLRKRWDADFHAHAAAYFSALAAILAPHERTRNPAGCVLALQLENELRSNIAGLIGGLDDEVRKLADVARAAGCTVPFFHNDDSPAGSWASGAPTRVPKKAFARKGPPEYRTDLYGFDLYFTFPPGDRSGDMSSSQVGMIEAGGVSSCLNLCGVGGAGVGGSDAKGLRCLYNADTRAPPPPLAWATANHMPPAVDRLEATFAAIGGSAASAPPFVAETQVGWINQWARLRGYDDIYDFFGPLFSSTLLLSLAAQGVTMTNHYMGYGGTNWGAVGDTEVYSSYDYSAFIREFGMLSERGRRMRLAALFLRSFASRGLAHTDSLDAVGGKKSSNATQARVKATVPAALLAVRRAVLPDDASSMAVALSTISQPPMFAFVRNLFGSAGRFNLIVDNVILPCFVPPCDAMTVPLHYALGPAAKPTGSVFACTVPVIARGEHAGGELWVLRVREGEQGRLLLQLPATDGRRAVNVNFETLPADGSAGVCGALSASNQDQGAATSLLTAPLEELGLTHWDPFANNRAQPVDVRASTEPAGLCFTLAFSGRQDVSSVVSIRDEATPADQPPLLRLLCLSDDAASMFSADLSGDDPFLRPSSSDGASGKRPFAAAWGADELVFLPNGNLQMSCNSRQGECVYVLRDDVQGTDDLQRVASNVMPGLFQHATTPSSLAMSLQSQPGRPSGGGGGEDPLQRSYELSMDGWERRAIDWSVDAQWKDITYAQRDPLDHALCGGHVAYRVRFRSPSKKISMVLNIRHVAGVWCNGVACGNQIVYSHNVASAGAMHAVDLHQAGKQRHDLTPGIAALAPGGDGVHEVIILVLSFGQSRSPFLLNDIRNKRGLLSARISRLARVTDVKWAICGVDAKSLENAYDSTGLPLENHANDRSVTAGFSPTPSPALVASDGVVYFRSSFKVPACSVVGGNVRYPLRLRINATRRTVAMLWVNGLQLGRFVQAAGPQSDFYVPEGVITEWKDNLLVVAVWGSTDGDFSIKMLPWVVDKRSGNIDPSAGDVYAVRTTEIRLLGKGSAPGGVPQSEANASEPVLSAL